MASTLISQRRSAPDSNRRTRPRPPTKLPPAIIVDGGANALAIARSLGRRGVKVYAINQSRALVRYSRHARWIPMPDGGESADAWMDVLLGPRSDHLRGAVLLAAGDAASVR